MEIYWKRLRTEREEANAEEWDAECSGRNVVKRLIYMLPVEYEQFISLLCSNTNNNNTNNFALWWRARQHALSSMNVQWSTDDKICWKERSNLFMHSLAPDPAATVAACAVIHGIFAVLLFPTV